MRASSFTDVFRHHLWRPPYVRKIYRDYLGFRGEAVSRQQALKNVFEWIRLSFQATGDGGSSAYYEMGRGWQASYPETTGYLIPTLIDYAAESGDPSWLQLARRAGKWLLEIQSNEGGWQGLQVHARAPLRVFNTAMIMDGLETLYRHDKDETYLAAAQKGAQWIISRCDDLGNFSHDNHSTGGAFDSLVAASVLQTSRHLPSSKAEPLQSAARRALDNIVAWQNSNGWFNHCNDDQKVQLRGTALLHHLGYTLDGLWRSAGILNDERYRQAVDLAASPMRRYFEHHGDLPAEFLPDWTPFRDRLFGKYSLCLTGYSQIAIIWTLLSRKNGDDAYLKAAIALVRELARLSSQDLGDPGMTFGIGGSYPINGDYQRYQFVNWAAKYHADSLLLLPSEEFNQ